MCGLSQLVKKPDCVVYSFGEYEPDSSESFELELLDRTEHCEVFVYAPSAFRLYFPGPTKYALMNSTQFDDRVHFLPYALSTKGKETSAPILPDSTWFGAKTLESLMEMNGHKHVDIVVVHSSQLMKAFEMFPPLQSSGKEERTPVPPYGQLVIDVYPWGKSFEEVLEWFEGMEEAGLRPFASEVGLLIIVWTRLA